MLFTDLPSDMLQAIADRVVSDAHGNKTIPGLIAGRGMRGASKALLHIITYTETPFDGDVAYKGSWPGSFVGGLGFGDSVKSETRFFVVRDRRSGKAFACTIDEGHRIDGVCTVKRTWPLWRLAQLLNGHNADLTQRLTDVESVSEGEAVMVPKRELSPNTLAVKAHNQLRTISRGSHEACCTTNYTDYVSHYVVPMPGTRDWVKMPSLVVHSSKDYGHRTFVLNVRCPLDPDAFCSPGNPYIHALAIALGWFDEGSVVQATGWMTSLYCHGRTTAPTAYKGPTRLSRLQRMAELAQRLVRKRAHTANGKRKERWNDGPAARVLLRQPRQSAMRAKTLMATQIEYDAMANSDGRLHAHLQPKESRDLEARGIIDDMYAVAGAQAGIDFDSDGQFDSDGEVTELSATEWRTHNYAAAMAAQEAERANLLEPSDDEALGS